MNAEPPSQYLVDELNQQARAMYCDRSHAARVLAEQACSMAVSIDYHFGYVEGLLNQARAQILQGAYAEAIALMRHSMFLGEEYGYKIHVAECLQEIARAHYVLAEYDTALEYWASCLSASLDAEAHEAYVRAQIGMGQIYFAHDDFQSAYEHHLKAEEGLTALDNDNLKVAVLINLGVDLHRLDRCDEALQPLQQALRMVEQRMHREYEADTYSGIGHIYLTQGRLDDAEQCLLHAWEVNRDHGHLWGEAFNQLLLGKLARARGNEIRALELLLKAQQQAEAIAAAHLQFQIDEQLSYIYEALGQPHEALAAYRAYHRGYLAILRQSSPQKLRMLQMQLEMEKARLENALLRQQRASQHKELKRVEKMACQDALTGVLNRRGIDMQGNQLFMRARDEVKPLVVLMIDIDHFKRVNDQYGHALGDKVLRQVAALIKSGCRQDDLVARYGGEEFLVMLPGRRCADAFDVAERLRGLIGGWSWTRIHPDLTLTISVGIAECGLESTLAPLLDRADRQLYRAKAAGRNRVVMEPELDAAQP
ncbi:diguanylate cyclase (GGDEF) domain-containing protein [Andreprevotia lacus DSM 23236]|jgi:diguanylate cyclase (GGDEF)-like protein|uniref:diguanylate cyclase n=1 Tax=Andreprevotia lacus DSM 23236 TaxID=1121001 RepID=A0A1W1X3I9_9NEIS|nr:tetratricopeptide repeat-containing diguanylate cyclase [Andreprevotia lacus]SMC18360.1 diguanylate cyclase (GGDEF) domain-containing protein [Andreprevotia lacus DSM 23236]